MFDYSSLQIDHYNSRNKDQITNSAHSSKCYDSSRTLSMLNTEILMMLNTEILMSKKAEKLQVQQQNLYYFQQGFQVVKDKGAAPSSDPSTNQIDQAKCGSLSKVIPFSPYSPAKCSEDNTQ